MVFVNLDIVVAISHLYAYTYQSPHTHPLSPYPLPRTTPSNLDNTHPRPLFFPIFIPIYTTLLLLLAHRTRFLSIRAFVVISSPDTEVGWW